MSRHDGLIVPVCSDAALAASNEGGIGSPSEADRNAVVGVDQPDRISEVRQFLVVELGARDLLVGVGRMGVGNQRDGFGPLQGGAFAIRIQRAGLPPGLQQQQFGNRRPFLQ